MFYWGMIHIWIKGEVGAPLNWFKPSSKIFYWPFQGGTSFVDLLCFCSVLCLLCLCTRLFICALWSPAGKGLTSWLSFVVSNCEFVTFPLVSWVGCGTWLYRLLIFAPLLTLLQRTGSIFDTLIQRTDGCLDVPWLLVQPRRIIRCSHKRYENRHFNQHMIFQYCEEGSGESVQTCRLPRAFAANTRDLDFYYIVKWLCLRKCADSPEYWLLAWIAHQSPFKAAQEILYSDEG